MIFKADITRRIRTDFGEESGEVFKILRNAIENTEYLKTARVIRCIVFLSKGNINEFNRLINVAINDPRDVMFWAEYKNVNSNFNYRRIRDFNKTFEESARNVKK